jgi:uncharacterized membrane protein YgcG
LQACGIGLNLLNIVGFIIYNILNKIAGTERAKYRLWSKQMFSFGTNTANHTIILLLGLSYCCLAPLIAPFCLLYYVLALVSQQYKLVYVNSREYEATGRMWYTVREGEGGGGGGPGWEGGGTGGGEGRGGGCFGCFGGQREGGTGRSV